MPSRTDRDAVELESPITDEADRPEVGVDPERVEQLVKPCDDWILLRMDPPLRSSRGGILIGDASVPESRVGVVVAQGDGFLLPNGKDYAKMNCEPGDRVLVERRAGKTLPGVRDETDARTGKRGYLLIRNGSVVSVVRRVAREHKAVPGDKLPQLELAPADIDPCGDWALVRTDSPRGAHSTSARGKKLMVPKFLQSEVEKARQSQKTDTWSGVVVKAGPGRLAEDGVTRAPVRAKRGMRILFLHDQLNQTIPTVDGHVLVLDREVVPAVLVGA